MVSRNFNTVLVSAVCGGLLGCQFSDHVVIGGWLILIIPIYASLAHNGLVTNLFNWP